ncbi:response regulator transcription factor [Draconibacterium sp. IB214405]|uniref:response regulator transcription factor n=1 Tax=Draconibacterium sp. IB214405 TaxID=3097352 RepID=UPI002A13E8E9|nr:response regulator transcription factor [Draconibacterium sp. IB214405]MDX8339537.1 response regulator transcription factor [Draconibacterium sp. IB214405]
MCYIAILENYSLFCSGIKSVLEDTGECDIVFESKTISDFLNKLKANKPDIIIIDIIHCLDEGISTIKKIRRKTSRTPILLVVSTDYSDFFEEYISLGVNGFVFNDSEAENLSHAIKSLKNGEDHFPPRVWQLLKRYLQTKKINATYEDKKILTNRELTILKLFCKGYTYKEIGAKLNISPRTVESHKKNIQTKISVRSTAEMVEFAYQNNLH